MAKFQPRITSDVGVTVPVEGELVATEDGRVYLGTPSKLLPLFGSVIAVPDMQTLTIMVKYPDKLYSVGDDVYRWDGTALQKVNASCGVAEVDYDTETMSYSILGRVLDKQGKPSETVIEIDRMLDLFGENVADTRGGWLKLKDLSHAESEALVALGEPVIRVLTFWEYQTLFPEGLTREQFGAGVAWEFQYDGTAWSPVNPMITEMKLGFESYLQRILGTTLSEFNQLPNAWDDKNTYESKYQVWQYVKNWQSVWTLTQKNYMMCGWRFEVDLQTQQYTSLGEVELFPHYRYKVDGVTTHVERWELTPQLAPEPYIEPTDEVYSG